MSNIRKLYENMLKGWVIDLMKRKKSQAVIKRPNWTLYWKGRRDSGKGEKVCNAYIAVIYKKLAEKETAEVLQTEEILLTDRKEAAVLLEKWDALEREMGFHHISDTLERLQAEREWKRKAAEIRQKLIEINEKLISENMILDERLHKLRSHVKAKVNSYITGIRAGKLKDYSCSECCPDNRAREIYTDSHRILDDKIRRIAEQGKEEGK